MRLIPKFLTHLLLYSKRMLCIIAVVSQLNRFDSFHKVIKSNFLHSVLCLLAILLKNRVMSKVKER
jgi:hypothetical protein